MYNILCAVADIAVRLVLAILAALGAKGRDYSSQVMTEQEGSMDVSIAVKGQKRRKSSSTS